MSLTACCAKLGGVIDCQLIETMFLSDLFLSLCAVCCLLARLLVWLFYSS